MVEMDLRPVIGRVGIDYRHPCSPLGAAAVATLGVLGDADACQVRGQLAAADSTVLRQLRTGNDRLPSHPTRQRGAAVSGGHG